MPPLPILVLVAFLLDLAAVVTYGVKEQDRFANFQISTHAGQVNDELIHAFGYSLYLAAVAALVLLVDFIVGLCLVKTSKISPV